jgi:hypothetical protein
MLYTFDFMETLLIYQAIPDRVKVIIWEGDQFEACLERNETSAVDQDEGTITWQTGRKGCIKTNEFPDGIPLWKSFLFHFWLGGHHPLGPDWILAPYDYGPEGTFEGHIPNHYLGEKEHARFLN